MSKRLSSPLLALGLACSLLLAGCQTAVPVAVRPAVSFGLGPIETAEPVVAPTIRTLSGDVEAELPAETLLGLATEASMAVASEPAAAPTASSTAKPVEAENDLDPAPILEAPLPAPAEATEAFPAVAHEAPATELEPPAQSGVWEFTWQLGEEDTRQETYHLTLQSEGTVEVEEGGSDPEFDNLWMGDQVQFAGGLFEFTPHNGAACQRYQLQVIAPDQMEGTVSLMINHRWVELPVTATRVES